MNTIEKMPEKANEGLDQLLQEAVLAHGYGKVLDRLKVAREAVKDHRSGKVVDARYLLTLTPEQREPYLTAAVDDALPLYDADRARPEVERELTMDLETGDFHEYEAEEAHAA